MAKKTRAQRKKQTQRALNNPNQAPMQDAPVGDYSDEAESVEAVDPAAEAAAIEQAEKEAAAEEARKLSEREAKQREKLIEREKRAAKRAEAKRGRKERRGPKFFWKLADYLKNVRTEMRRVTWPSRPEVGRMSLVVVFALVFFGVLIYIVDSAVTPVLYALSGLGG
ncbi:MAG: preprotein translocase subunit SecE [Coriobacteriales bacterium]|jgi:preprotein translocase subunit SecE